MAPWPACSNARSIQPAAGLVIVNAGTDADSCAIAADDELVVVMQITVSVTWTTELEPLCIDPVQAPPLAVAVD
jgi:hypothetical protein